MKTQDQNPRHSYRARLFQAFVILAAVAFGMLFLLARNAPYFAFDLPIELAVQRITLPGFESLMVLLTELGRFPLAYIWCGAVVIFLFVAGYRWEAVMACFSVVGIGLLGDVLKEIAHRARPTPDLVNVFGALNDYSFPSGHVLFFTAFLGFLIFLLYALAPHSWWRTLGMILLAVPIALISVSRVYLGQHWPSDTLGAYLLASLWLGLVIYIYRWGKKRKFLEKLGAQ